MTKTLSLSLMINLKSEKRRNDLNLKSRNPMSRNPYKYVFKSLNGNSTA